MIQPADSLFASIHYAIADQPILFFDAAHVFYLSNAGMTYANNRVLANVRFAMTRQPGRDDRRARAPAAARHVMM